MEDSEREDGLGLIGGLEGSKNPGDVLDLVSMTKGSLVNVETARDIETEINHCTRLNDTELWEGLPRLARGEREQLAKFLIHLGEIERRDLHLDHAHSGLFTYLVMLGFSEWEARARAVAAHKARDFPSILTLLATGRLHLYAVVLLAPHLTSENHESLLNKACRRTTRELQAMIAAMDPGTARRDVIRVVSAPAPAASLDNGPDAGGASCATPAFPPAASPASAPPPDGGDILFPEFGAPPHPGSPADGAASTAMRPADCCGQAGSTRLRFSFDGDEELEKSFRRAQELLRHKYPYGAMGHIFHDALQALLDRIDPDRRIARKLARARRRGRLGATQ
ncbi:MAG: hypothetical protein WC728_04885 [Elusimicrobiota bacterium]